MTQTEKELTEKLVEELKEEITSSRERTKLLVNKEMIVSYWRIGKKILVLQDMGLWRLNRLEMISETLEEHFYNNKGFSARNLKYMKRFAKEFPDFQEVNDLVARIPWGHVCVIMERIGNYDERIECIKKDIENKWSRMKLTSNIRKMKKQKEQKTIEY